MSNQLDLFSYTPEPVENPLPPPKRMTRNSVLWNLAVADFCLQTMNTIAASEKLSAETKRREITRLALMREQALARIPPSLPAAPTQEPTQD